MASQKIYFKCSECGEKSWMIVDLETYIITSADLLCDNCNPVEDEE